MCNLCGFHTLAGKDSMHTLKIIRFELTLPWLKHRGFFLQPATLRALTLPERVAGVCPEALRTF